MVIVVMYHHSGFLPVLITSIVGSVWSAVVIVFIVLMIVGMWRMFEKAGEPGWTSLIPFVSSYMLFKIGWGSGWLFLLGFIPIVNVVVGIMLSIKLARAFGMGAGFAVGLIFLPSIFYMILGFSDAVYYGPQEN